jgi:hypothetical protein
MTNPSSTVLLFYMSFALRRVLGRKPGAAAGSSWVLLADGTKAWAVDGAATVMLARFMAASLAATIRGG